MVVFVSEIKLVICKVAELVTPDRLGSARPPSLPDLLRAHRSVKAQWPTEHLPQSLGGTCTSAF